MSFTNLSSKTEEKVFFSIDLFLFFGSQNKDQL